MVIRIVVINVIIQGENVYFKGKKVKDEFLRILLFNVCIEDDNFRDDVKGEGEEC